MTILELFNQTNLYNLVVAYEKLFPYEEYDWLMSRNLKDVFCQTQGILKVFKEIQDGKYKALSKEYVKKLPTIYVFEFNSTRLGERKTSFEAFTLDSLNIKTIQDFYINRKEIEFSSKIEKNIEYLNYNVAKQSIDTYGIDICAATILRTLIRMGYNEETVQHNIEYIISKLDKAEEDIKAGRTYTMEEVKEHLNALETKHRQGLNKFDLAICKGYDAQQEVLEPLEDEYRKKVEQENIDNLNKFINEKESK